MQAARPVEVVATEPLVVRDCRFNESRIGSADFVTPRGERKPLVRMKGSWEAK